MLLLVYKWREGREEREGGKEELFLGYGESTAVFSDFLRDEKGFEIVGRIEIFHISPKNVCMHPIEGCFPGNAPERKRYKMDRRHMPRIPKYSRSDCNFEMSNNR